MKREQKGNRNRVNQSLLIRFFFEKCFKDMNYHKMHLALGHI